VSGHVAKALTTPVADVFCLVDVSHIVFYSGFSQHIETLEDALIWEVQPTIAMVAILLCGFLLGAVLGNGISKNTGYCQTFYWCPAGKQCKLHKFTSQI